jgi:hypothetical protein
LTVTLGGLTMSLDGGLDEFDEFFFSRASCCSNSAMRARRGATAAATAASIRA